MDQFFFSLNKTIKTLLFPVKMESAVEIGEETIKRLNGEKQKMRKIIKDTNFFGV